MIRQGLKLVDVLHQLLSSSVDWRESSFRNAFRALNKNHFHPLPSEPITAANHPLLASTFSEFFLSIACSREVENFEMECSE